MKTGYKTVTEGSLVTIKDEITLQKLDERLTPFKERSNKLQTQLGVTNQELGKLSCSSEIEEQKIKQCEFRIKYIESKKDIFISWETGCEDRIKWKRYKDVLNYYYTQDKNLVIYFPADLSLGIVKNLVSLNRRIEQIDESIRRNTRLESTEFDFYKVEDDEVYFGFLTDKVVICKKDSLDENIEIGNNVCWTSNEQKFKCFKITLEIIKDPNFNLLDHVHIVETADIEKVKRDIEDKLPNQDNYLVDINYEKQGLGICEIEITPRNKSISKHKILSAVKLNDDISIIRNYRKISILLPVGKLLEYAKKAECDYIKFFERDKNKELAALIGVITFGVSAISTTILLYSFIQKQNKFIIYETSVLLLEVLLAVCTSMCFYTYRDEKLTQIGLSGTNGEEVGLTWSM